MRRRLTAAAIAAVLIFSGKNAFAQAIMMNGHLGVGSGVEAGDPGTGETAFRRARTRVVGGVDIRQTEDSMGGVTFRAFAEVEPHTSFGGEARYIRWITPSIAGFGGITGVAAPHILIGGVIGGHWQIPARPFGLFVEPSISVLPFGTDLVNDRVLLWGLLTVGVRADILVPPKEEN